MLYSVFMQTYHGYRDTDLDVMPFRRFWQLAQLCPGFQGAVAVTPDDHKAFVKSNIVQMHERKAQLTRERQAANDH